MEPRDLAQKHFREYRTHGKELVPTYCPFCRGGQNRDKHTFSLNAESGAYNCLRGSCGVSGSFKQLCEHFGEKIKPNYEYRPRQEVRYVPPATQPKPPANKVEAYLQRRGFSRETWERRGVAEHEGNIAMPYTENGQVVLMKFRPPHKPKQGEKKGWKEKGGKPVFWGMDECSMDKPLVICEGEMDALALDECGIPNVVSVPNGAEDLTCVDLCWDWLDGFRKVILWTDNDEPGIKLQRNLITRLGAWRCYVVVNKRKDANEALLLDGKDAIRHAIKHAVEVPIDGLIRLADVEPFDYSSATRIRSGINSLDKIVGGWMTTEVSVWTGINSSGKTTLLNQLLLEAVNQRYSVGIYSGEIPAKVLRYWMDLQAAGVHIEKRHDHIREMDVPYPKATVTKKIRDWYRDKVFVYDSFGVATEEKLFEVFTYAARRYGCRMFLIDNLMAMVFAGNDRDFYLKQGEFVRKIKAFAKQHDAHVHLVAHPRKVTGRLTKMDVAGSSNVTNWADNVFSVHRCTPEEKEQTGKDAFLDVFKNRFMGRQDETIGLNFNEDNKRLYGFGEPKAPKYTWDIPTVLEVAKLFGDA